MYTYESWKENKISETKKKRGFKRWKYVIALICDEVKYIDDKMFEMQQEIEELKQELRNHKKTLVNYERIDLK